MALIGRIIHGNLRITRLIGKGAMGLMLFAENVELPERKYAVKVLLSPVTAAPKFQERFSEEARNQAGLDHPNIVRVHDYFREGGRYFLVMDYVNGQSLQKIITEHGRLEEARAIEILDEVLQALECAHRHGIVHRDVKPSNILIDNAGRARLTDFGIAVRAGGMRLTGTGMSVIGTAAYMSPEQIRTPMQVDPRIDVYACGIVLYEMLTGDVPFRGDSDFAVSQSQISAVPPDPRSINPAISKRVARIITMALAKDPRHRPQSCEQFRSMLAGDVDPPMVWKPAAWAAAAASLCVAIYLTVPRWGQWLPHAPAPAPAADFGQAHDTALAALQSLSLLCRESAVKRKKEEGKRIAESIPDSAVADNFARQIEEADRNIAEFAEQYNHNVGKLAGVEEAALRQAFEGAAQDSKRADYVSAIELDTKRMKKAALDIDASRMAQNCGGWEVSR